jgi:hypothetical protein
MEPWSLHEGEMSVPFETLTMKAPRNEERMDWMILTKTPAMNVL